MEIVKKQDIPDLPVLSNEKRDLVGFHGRLSDFALSRMERRARRKKREIIIETEIQLVRDRVAELVRAYRITIAEAMAVITKQTEEEAQAEIELSEERIGANKIQAMEKAADEFEKFLRRIPENMSDAVKSQLLKRANAVFERTLEKIEACDFSIEAQVARDYVEKKSFFGRFRR